MCFILLRIHEAHNCTIQWMTERRQPSHIPLKVKPKDVRASSLEAVHTFPNWGLASHKQFRQLKGRKVRGSQTWKRMCTNSVPYAHKTDYGMALVSRLLLSRPLNITGQECWAGVGESQEGPLSQGRYTSKRDTLDYQIGICKVLEKT